MKTAATSPVDSLMLLRKKTWLRAQKQLEEHEATIERLQAALSLVPIEKMELGDIWFPSAWTIDKIKTLTSNRRTS